MFSFLTYIKKPEVDIRDLNDVSLHPDKYYIELDNSKAILKVKDQINLEYMDGVIVFKYYDEMVFDFTLWDSNNYLWGYLINLVKDIINNKTGEMFFPDSPIKISAVLNNSDNLLFSLTVNNEKKWNFPKKDFLLSLLNNGEDVFKKLMQYFGDYNGEYSSLINEIHKLKDLI